MTIKLMHLERGHFELQYFPPEPEEGIFTIPGQKHINYVNIPPELVHATGELGIKRAKFIETRIQKILVNKANIVSSVLRHPFGSDEDGDGHDLTVTLKDSYPVKQVYIQVKSSRGQICAYKHWIRDKYFPNAKENTDNLIRRWLTTNKIILINGAETKSQNEILEDSFYPQLERILNVGDIPKTKGQITIGWNNLPVQTHPTIKPQVQELTHLSFS